MMELCAQDVLVLWERSRRQHPVDRTLTLASTQWPQLKWRELAELSLGQLNYALLALYEQTFGRTLLCQVACPQCQAAFEFELDTQSLRQSSLSAGLPLQCQVDEWEVAFRPPNSCDLACLAVQRDLAGGCKSGAQLLAQRCIVTVHHPELSGSAQLLALPESVLDAVAARILEAEPLTELLLDLSCPDCKYAWRPAVDLASFAWTEFSRCAKRLLWEVHTLARHYGWTESTILTLSQERRQSYLELIGA